MLGHYAAQWTKRIKAEARTPVVSPRRVSHGGSGWIHEPAAERHQPQDGSSDDAFETSSASRHGVTEMSIAWMEPEDARLTGGTRSLMRRLMGLNVPRGQQAQKPAPVAVVSPAVATPKPVTSVRRRKTSTEHATPGQAA